jgi:acyl-coenzyme A thioesterase PaaI-like protein
LEKTLFHRIIDRLPISIIRFIFNCWPPFRGAGIKVNNISPDYRSFDVSMKLKLLNRNYAGVHFGGSLFSMTDPFHMVMLSQNLGSQYIVWDKAAKIEFKKVGRGTIRAKCSITKEEIDTVKNETDRLGKYIFNRTVDLFNDKNEVVATITKTLYVRKRDLVNV